MNHVQKKISARMESVTHIVNQDKIVSETNIATCKILPGYYYLLFFKPLLFRNFNICLDKCSSNYECDKGQTCYNQQCLKSCNQENDCQDGQYCHEDHKVCQDFCLSD